MDLINLIIYAYFINRFNKKTIINFTIIKMIYNSLHFFINLNVQIKPKLT